MLWEVNRILKAECILKYGTLTSAARAFKAAGLDNMDVFRLSRIIHGRAQSRPEERRIISQVLQRKMVELFPEYEPSTKEGTKGKNDGL
jgi:hypothetical protein